MPRPQNGSDVESVILDVLKEVEPTLMEELVQQVNQRETDSVDEFEVRKAVWRLMDRRSVDLTPDRRLRRSPV